MHQTKKGNQWSFGMKAHLGADVQSGLVHRVTGTAAHVADIAQTRALRHGGSHGGRHGQRTHRAIGASQSTSAGAGGASLYQRHSAALPSCSSGRQRDTFTGLPCRRFQ